MRPEYREEPCRSALNRVKGMMFGWSLNPYMGCAHQCTFCYVRAFEKRADRPSDDRYGASIRVKTNVVEVLRRELARRSWKGEVVAIGAATDPYQPAEGHYRLTRGCIEALGEVRNPFAIITRGPMIVRDIDMLVEAGRRASVSVTFSIPTLDDRIWRLTEPNAPPPRQRLRALRRLRDAGIEAGVGMAPILPGLSDKPELMADVVRAARDAGATSIWTNVLYLRPGTREHFLENLARDWPELVPRYERLYRGRVPRQGGGRAGAAGGGRAPRPLRHRRTPPRVTSRGHGVTSTGRAGFSTSGRPARGANGSSAAGELHWSASSDCPVMGPTTGCRSTRPARPRPAASGARHTAAPPCCGPGGPGISACRLDGNRRVRGRCFTAEVGTPRQIAEARRQATRVHRSLAEDVRRLRQDAGATRAQLAESAGIDLAFLCRIEDGRERPSIDTYAKLSVALGSDLNSRLYPNTGPTIRDRHQARILEALLSVLHPRWQAYPEVAVRQPSRGWIDVVLHAPRERQVISTEIQSDLVRLEQQIRWFLEKTAALPSWEGWSHLGEVVEPSRLLIIRSTRATRGISREFERQLATAYPAHPADAIAALTGTAPWPGAALVWADIEPERVRFIGRR